MVIPISFVCVVLITSKLQYLQNTSKVLCAEVTESKKSPIDLVSWKQRILELETINQLNKPNIYTTYSILSSTRSCYILSPRTGSTVREILSYSFCIVTFSKPFVQFLYKVRLHNSCYLVMADNLK